MKESIEFTTGTMKAIASLLIAMLEVAPEEAAAIGYSTIRTLFDVSKEAFDEYTKGIRDALIDIKKDEGY